MGVTVTSSENRQFDHLIYLRIYEGCNLKCDHCFIPSNPKKMSLQQIKEFTIHVHSKFRPGEHLLIQWHGGEPTSRGLRFVQLALQLINDELSSTFKISHSIQTNLINYTSEWGALFRQYYHSEVGISWDYSLRHYSHTKRTGLNYDDLFWSHVQQLIADEVTPYLVVTAAAPFFERYKDPNEFYNFLIERGVKYLHIEKLTKTGNASLNWDTIGLSNAEYSDNMIKFLKRYLMHKIMNTPLYVSPFDGLIDAVASLQNGVPQSYGCNSGNCDTRYHTFDASGYHRGCTALTTNEQLHKLNSPNVDTGQMISIVRRQKVFHCEDCKFRAICNSGCVTEPTNDGSGECSGAYRLYEAIATELTKGYLRN